MTAARETVTLQKNLSNENILFAGIKGATPSGSKQYSYKMPADGNGKKISNLTINTDKDDAGLFGYVGAGAIKNLTLINANVTSSWRLPVRSSVVLVTAILKTAT